MSPTGHSSPISHEQSCSAENRKVLEAHGASWDTWPGSGMCPLSPCLWPRWASHVSQTHPLCSVTVRVPQGEESKLLAWGSCPHCLHT